MKLNGFHRYWNLVWASVVPSPEEGTDLERVIRLDDSINIQKILVNKRWVYVVQSPSSIRKVLIDEMGSFVKVRKNRPLFGRGILTSEGGEWERQRVLLTDLFSSGRIERSATITRSLTEEMITRWRERYEPGIAFDVHAELARLSLQIVGKTFFNVDLSFCAPAIQEALTLLNHQKDRFQVRRVRAVVDWIYRQNQGRAESEKGVFLVALKGEPEELIKDQISTILLAGHETLASHLGFTLDLLARHAETQESCRREAGESGFLEAVIQESLRLYPPAWRLTRQAVRNVSVEGRLIPRGAILWVVPYRLHRNPQQWNEPERFMPERFLNSSGPSRYAYMPFGIGARSCLGSSLAQANARIILSTLLNGFRFETSEKAPPALDAAFTLRPRKGILLKVKPAS